jgi:predicted O-linked N-acetylglucosamine transferase (SPINDLY family)
MNWYPQAEELLLQGNYQQVAEFYEQAIDNDPDNIDNYWYLGLSYLLQKKEEDAQTTWFFPMSQGDEEEVNSWQSQLIEILLAEAQRQETLENDTLAWLIRGHIRELNPNLITNLLHLVKLSFKLKSFSQEQFNQWQIVELLKGNPTEKIDQTLLLQVLTEVLELPLFESVHFAEACLIYTSGGEKFLNLVRNVANNMTFEKAFPTYGIDLMNLCVNQQPDNLFYLKELYWFYAQAKMFGPALDVALKFKEKSDTTVLKVYGSYLLLYTKMMESNWLEVNKFADEHQRLLKQMIEEQPRIEQDFIRESLIIALTPLPYLQDQPQINRWLINEVSSLFQKNCQLGLEKSVQSSIVKVKQSEDRLKIGYIGHTFKVHSVGFLARWLLHHHDKEKFKITTYLISQREDYMTKEWFLPPHVEESYNFTRNVKKTIAQIQEDEIDILIDLDSLTFNLTCQVMANKPAPIQATWLGLDASGIPAIDYYIADPYVLPEQAQDYYQEKIWRLPHTYLAVDGFEVDVPTLTREDLDIPADAIIFLNVQNALKRNLHTIHLQMKILQAVKNSYLLIKGTGDPDLIKELFIHVAEAEGVDPNRLRFLSLDRSEKQHRANLQIADVVLDTYPYNGATTTLEVLWMGVPLVTRVGQQFAARNSYTFMINAGLTEGIAWTDEEYIEWGIKLGTDESLREKIAWKLRQSRRHSPLWNGKQFTREMENAYQQMWDIYVNKQS